MNDIENVLLALLGWGFLVAILVGLSEGWSSSVGAWINDKLTMILGFMMIAFVILVVVDIYTRFFSDTQEPSVQQEQSATKNAPKVAPKATPKPKAKAQKQLTQEERDNAEEEKLAKQKRQEQQAKDDARSKEKAVASEEARTVSIKALQKLIKTYEEEEWEDEVAYKVAVLSMEIINYEEQRRTHTNKEKEEQRTIKLNQARALIEHYFDEDIAQDDTHILATARLDITQQEELHYKNIKLLAK